MVSFLLFSLWCPYFSLSLFFIDQCSLSPEPTTSSGRKQTVFALLQSHCRAHHQPNQSGSCPTQDPFYGYWTANRDSKCCMDPCPTCLYPAHACFLRRYAVAAGGDHSQPRTHGGAVMGALRRHAPELPQSEPRPSRKGDSRKYLLTSKMYRNQAAETLLKWILCKINPSI